MMIRSKSSVESKEFFRDTDYSQQYYNTYGIRLETMSNILHSRIVEKWGTDIVIRKLSDLVTDERCLVIGTLYKNMEKKPSVIKELTDSHQLGLRSIIKHKLTSATDHLFLEDSQQRIQLLTGPMDTQKYVTGVVVALLGHETDIGKGIFVVEDVVHATPTFTLIQNPISQPIARYVAIVSGISLEDDFGVSVNFKLALDWMCGSLAMSAIDIDPRNIGRLIIAGNSLSICKNEINSQQNAKKINCDSLMPSEILDQLLDDACGSIPIDIMPGPNDPTSAMLPQKPLHKVRFPTASTWTTFNSRPNPWMFNLDNGAFVVGTSGQNIDDIDRYSQIDDALDRMKATITWGHVAPTAPDTLPTYPNIGPIDPLVMPHQPYLYFAGNQDKFAWTRLDQDHGMTTLLVTVPRFKDTGAVVLVDVHEHNCASITFERCSK